MNDIDVMNTFGSLSFNIFSTSGLISGSFWSMSATWKTYSVHYSVFNVMVNVDKVQCAFWWAAWEQQKFLNAVDKLSKPNAWKCL